MHKACTRPHLLEIRYRHRMTKQRFGSHKNLNDKRITCAFYDDLKSIFFFNKIPKYVMKIISFFIIFLRIKFYTKKFYCLSSFYRAHLSSRRIRDPHPLNYIYIYIINYPLHAHKSALMTQPTNGFRNGISICRRKT